MKGNQKIRKQAVKPNGKPVKVSPKQADKKPGTAAAWSPLRIQYLFLALLALALYVNTLDMDYALDDTLMITGNEFTKKGIEGIPDIMTHDAFIGFLGKGNLLPGGRYRPLSQVMFAVEYEIFGLNPFVGHLINLVLYIFLGLFLFYLLRKLLPEEGNRKWYLSVPFLASALFIAHPLHTEVVANIKGRDEILTMLGALGTLYFILKYTEKQKLIHLFWAALIFFLAILSKENALAYFAVLPLTLYFFRKGRTSHIFISMIPMAAAIGGYIILRAATVGFVMSEVHDTELLNNPFLEASAEQKYATILLTWGKYFLLLLFPHPLTHDYYPKQIPLIGFSDVRAIIPLLITLALGVIAVWKFRSRHIVAFAIFFFWLTFAMSSNLLINIGAFMNERFMFAPLLGFTLILAWLLMHPLGKKMKFSPAWRSAVLTVFLVLLAAWSVKTISRNRSWKNDLTLFTTDVKVSSNSAKCNTSAGGKLLEWSDSTANPIQRKEYLDLSVKYLRKSIDIYPRNIHSWILLGNAYIKLKDYPAARQCFTNCLQINPKHPASLNNLLHIAQVTNRDKLYEESVITYKLLMNLQPDSAIHPFGAGLAYKNAGRLDSAIYWFNASLQKDPEYGDAYGKLGEIYGQHFNDLKRSEDYLMKAVSCNPRDASSLENLGIIYALRKDYSKALEFFNQAYAISPDNAGLNRNLGKTYQDMGQADKANEYYSRANQLESQAVKP